MKLYELAGEKMVNLYTDLEKELWRSAAIAALKSVEDVKSNEGEAAIQFAATVADGVIRSYRKRTGIKND